MKIEAPKKDLTNRQAFCVDDLPEVIPFARRSIDRMISAGDFPKPDRKIGKRRIWTLDTIKNWLAGQ